MCVFFYFNLYLGQGNTKWSPVLNPYSVFSKFFASLNLLAMDVNESSMNFSFPVRGNSWLQDLISVISFHCRPIDSPSEKRDAVSTPVNKPLVHIFLDPWNMDTTRVECRCSTWNGHWHSLECATHCPFLYILIFLIFNFWFETQHK